MCYTVILIVFSLFASLGRLPCFLLSEKGKCIDVLRDDSLSLATDEKQMVFIFHGIIGCVVETCGHVAH